MRRYDPSVCSNLLIAHSARLREEQHRLADERRREFSDLVDFRVANSSYGSRLLSEAGSGHILAGSATCASPDP
jgi:hypothetical protein